MESSGTESPAAQAPVFTDNPEESRYEMRVQGELAGFVTYHRRGQAISLEHTEVEPAFQGAHLATHLARFVLDDARKRDLGRAAVLPLHQLLDQEAPGVRRPRPAGPPGRVRPGVTRNRDQRSQDKISAVKQ